MADLKTCFNSGSRNEFIGRAEFGVDLPFCPRQRFGEIPFPGHIGYSIGPPAATHPLDIFLEAAHSVATLLRRLAQLRAQKQMTVVFLSAQSKYTDIKPQRSEDRNSERSARPLIATPL